MNILAVDLGTYSLKIIEGKADRKHLSWINAQEIILSEVRENFPNKEGFELISELIKLYIEEAGFEGKVLFQLPSKLTTNRFLNLPVASKKKAELMIPFQLEEDLPFAAHQTHFAAQYLKTTGGFFALVSASLLTEFDNFFRTFENTPALGEVITSELSLMQSWISSFDESASILVLDLGHETTKMYSFHDNAVSSTHLSYIAGNKIEENIATHYSIDENEARVFKHQNAFFLTSNQYDQVDQDQADFGKLMKKTMAPLISEVNRLILGHRIKHGEKIKKIYLTGGSSKIKNLEGFLTEQLSIPTHCLELIPSRLSKQNQINQDFSSRIGMSYLLAQTVTEKKPIMNFRSGEYTSNAYEDLPLHSTAFIGVRVALACLVLTGFLMLERFLINSDIKKLNKNVNKIVKNPLLNISKRDRLSLKSKPEKVQKKLLRKKRSIDDEVNILKSSLGFNSTLPIDNLGQKVRKNLDFHLMKYSHKGTKVYARFQLNNEKKAEELENSIKRMNLKDLKLDYDKKLKQVSLEFKESGNG